MKQLKKIRIFALWLIASWFLYQCANPVSPGGGSKDEDPPQVVSSVPLNNSIFFDKKRISVTFDEFVKLKNPNQQVLISPPFATKPEYKMRGKTLMIDFEEELFPNTTYTIFFGNAIVDITADNPLSNYLYAFSTGDHIDSLAIGGEVVNAFDLQPRADVFVMLFPPAIDTIPQDSIPMLSRPLYVARTDEHGYFQLRNLSDRAYQLFALSDVNNNYLFDLPNEEIAFLDTLIRPEVFSLPVADTIITDTLLVKDGERIQDTAIISADSIQIEDIYDKYYQLFMFQQIDTVQRFLGTEVFYPPKFTLLYQFPAQDPRYWVINKDMGSDWKIDRLSSGRDTLSVWLKDMSLDSLQIAVADGDSIYDTVLIAFGSERKKYEKRKGRKKKDEENVERMQIKTNARSRTIDLGKPFQLIMENPLERWDFSTTTFIAGEDTLMGAPFVLADSLATRFTLDYEMTEATSYEFIFPDSAFYTIYGLTNDSLQAKLKTAEIRDYGVLVLDIEIGEHPYIVQLMDAKERVLDTFYLTESEKLKLEYLKPGKYLLKVIQDKWRNKRWDTGIYVDMRQPEKVYYFRGEVEIRANWDVEEQWVLP